MSQHRLLSTSGFKDIGLGMGGGFASLATGWIPTHLQDLWIPGGFQPGGWVWVPGQP